MIAITILHGFKVRINMYSGVRFGLSHPAAHLCMYIVTYFIQPECSPRIEFGRYGSHLLHGTYDSDNAIYGAPMYTSHL
jgi:hypothetical protein